MLKKNHQSRRYKKAVKNSIEEIRIPCSVELSNIGRYFSNQSGLKISITKNVPQNQYINEKK